MFNASVTWRVIDHPLGGYTAQVKLTKCPELQENEQWVDCSHFIRTASYDQAWSQAKIAAFGLAAEALVKMVAPFYLDRKPRMLDKRAAMFGKRI